MFLVALTAMTLLGQPAMITGNTFAIASSSDDAWGAPAAPAEVPARVVAPDASAPTADDSAVHVSVTHPQKAVACGQSFSCVTKAAKKCAAASYRFVSPPVDIMGSTITASRQLTIRGASADKRCVVDMQQLKTGYRLSPKMIARARAAHVPASTIQKQEADGRKLAQMLDGKRGTCVYRTAGDLVQLLSDWHRGNFESNFHGARCTGPLFDGQ